MENGRGATDGHTPRTAYKVSIGFPVLAYVSDWNLGSSLDTGSAKR